MSSSPFFVGTFVNNRVLEGIEITVFKGFLEKTVMWIKWLVFYTLVWYSGTGYSIGFILP